MSVSVAPVSYFFCAEAAEADSAIASAVPVTRWRIPFLIMLISSCVVIEPTVLSRALIGPVDAIAGRDTGGTLAAMQGEPCRKGERFRADESRIDAGAVAQRLFSP